MKKILINLFILSLFGIFITSCSEDPVKPPVNNKGEGNKYFPLKTGSWWTYTNYTLDRDGNKIETSVFTSKYIIGGTETKGGKTAYIFNIQDLQGNKIDDSKFYYTTETQLFEFSKLLPPMDFAIPVNIPETWYNIADQNGTEWTLYTEDLDKVEFVFMGYTLLLDDVFEIKAKYEGTETVTYGANLDKTVEAKKFKINYKFGGNTLLAGTIPVQIPFDVEAIYHYAENIGLVKQEMKPMSIVIIGTEYYYLPGSVQVLLEYNIAQ